LFDDQSWQVRYLVVDVGHWLKRRDAVLPISALDAPDWSHRLARTRLTKQQVHDSPDVDTEKPVSRQQELAMQEYFGPLASWVDRTTGVAMPTQTTYPMRTPGDPHLRSATHVLGYEVWATDGQIGRLDGFVMDEASWHIGFLDVKAGGRLDYRSTLIPTAWVLSISWPEFRVLLQRPKTG
jgi:hypothetical protein